MSNSAHITINGQSLCEAHGELILTQVEPEPGHFRLITCDYRSDSDALLVAAALRRRFNPDVDVTVVPGGCPVS